MHRRLLFLIGLCLVLAACADTAAESDTTVGTTAALSTAPDASSTTQPSPSTTRSSTTEQGRQVAPDFTLDLGDGGLYRLYEGSSPVYLVFWAEW